MTVFLITEQNKNKFITFKPVRTSSKSSYLEGKKVNFVDYSWGLNVVKYRTLELQH